MRALLLFALTLAAAFYVTGTAGAYNVGYYTHNTCVNWNDTSTRVDPVNFFFYDWGTTGRVENQTHFHGSNQGYPFSLNQGGSHQDFIVNNQCYDQYGQMATGPEGSSRYHFRYEPVPYESGTIGWSNLADAHHDVLVVCGVGLNHAVDQNGTYPGYGTGSGFDYGQYITYWAFYGASSHTTFQAEVFNTQMFRQCNGWIASDNGYAQWMQLHQVNH